MIDYDKRLRNHSIESDRYYAIGTMQQVNDSLIKPDKDLIMNVEYGSGEEHSSQVFTNYLRELVYNMEHTVHHMALIRIGAVAISDVDIPAEFGVAASTLKFRKICAR